MKSKRRDKSKHLFDRGEVDLSIESLHDLIRSIFVALLDMVWGVLTEPLDLDEMTLIETTKRY